MVSLVTRNWRLNNIDTILFDKDGTFIDLHYFWGKMTEMRALKVIKFFELNEDCFEKICYFLGYDNKTGKMFSDGITALYSRVKIIEIFRGNLEELGIKTTEKVLEEIFDIVSEEFYKNIMDYTKPIEEAVEFIKKAYSKRVKLGVVTSDSVISTNLTLKNFGWEKYFSSIVGRELSLETKESGVLTTIALKELNANTETTIMIGDAPMDYISAKNAGIEKTILVATGQIDFTELGKISNFVVNTLADVEIM